MPYWIINPDTGQPEYVGDDGDLRATAQPPGESPTPPAPLDELDAAYAAAQEAAGVGVAPVSSEGTASDPPLTQVGRGGSVAVSSAGTPEKDRKKFRSDVDRDFYTIDQDAQAQLAQDVQATRGAYGDAANIIAKVDETADAPSLYAAERAKIEGESQLNRMLSDMNLRFAQEEQQATAAAVAVTQKAKADYMSQVKAYQALSVDPGQLWGNLTPAMQKGALFSVFAHNFLGAQGVQTTAMDSLNRAIDQNIDAQVQNINKQGQVAEHFRSLYNMAVQESATSEEARSRLRGFYYAAAEKQVLAELAQYDAPIAQARAAEAVANLRIAYEKEIQNLEDRWLNRAQQAKALYLDRRGMELDAAYKSQMLKLQRDELQFRKDVEAGKAVPVTDENVWVDPVTKKPAAILRTDITKEKKAEFLDRSAAVRTAVKKIAKLKAMVRKHGPVTDAGSWSNAVNGPEGQLIIQLWEDAATELTYAKSGKQTTDKEIERFRTMLAPETLTRMGNGAIKTLSQYIQGTSTGFQDQAAQFVRDPMTAAEASSLASYSPYKGGEYSIAGAEGTEAEVDLQDPFAEDEVDWAFTEAQRPNEDHTQGVRKAINVAIKSGDVDKLTKAVENVNAIYTGDSRGVDYQELNVYADQLARAYRNKTGNWPPGYIGDLFRKDDEARAKEREEYTGPITPMNFDPSQPVDTPE